MSQFVTKVDLILPFTFFKAPAVPTACPLQCNLYCKEIYVRGSML